MNQSLQSIIYNQIKSAVSATTSHVYFLYLPSQELLDRLTVVYELNNSENENTFDSKEASKTYTLRIKLNAPKLDLFANNSIYIKNKVQRLNQVEARAKYITLVDEETFFDDELNVFTEYLRFEIQYH